MLSNREVIKSFVYKGRSNNANVHSEGDKLFSYNTIIAQWVEPYVLKINVTRYSSTTSRHLSLLRSALNDIELDRIEEVNDIPINTQTL